MKPEVFVTMEGYHHSYQENGWTTGGDSSMLQGQPNTLRVDT
jgi:hypothetical protein